MWRPTPMTDEKIDAFRTAMDTHNMQASVTHAMYLINLGSDNPDLFDKSVTALSNTMIAADQLGLDGVVFHVGSHKGAGLDGCIDQIAAAMLRVLELSSTTWLLMENSAGQGGTIGRSVDELAALMGAAGNPDRLGICIDTCHWWVSGVDITDPKVLDRELHAIDESMGLDRLRALHVNDALTDFASNRDRHANINDGTIGAGMQTFLGDPRLQHLPAYLEVPGDGDGATVEQVQRLKQLHARALA